MSVKFYTHSVVHIDGDCSLVFIFYDVLFFNIRKKILIICLSFKRHSRERKYDREKKAKALYKEEVSNHPLKGITITVSINSTEKTLTV